MLLEMIQWEAEILHFKKNEHRKKQLQTIKLNLETNDADIERNSRTDKQQIYIDRNFLNLYSRFILNLNLKNILLGKLKKTQLLK